MARNARAQRQTPTQAEHAQTPALRDACARCACVAVVVVVVVAGPEVVKVGLMLLAVLLEGALVMGGGSFKGRCSAKGDQLERQRTRQGIICVYGPELTR